MDGAANLRQLIAALTLPAARGKSGRSPAAIAALTPSTACKTACVKALDSALRS